MYHILDRLIFFSSTNIADDKLKEWKNHHIYFTRKEKKKNEKEIFQGFGGPERLFVCNRSGLLFISLSIAGVRILMSGFSSNANMNSPTFVTIPSRSRKGK